MTGPPDPAARRRRLVDAARILPFAATLLMLLPLAWEPAAGAPARDTAADAIYLFLLWAALIAAAAGLAAGLGRAPPGGDDG
jgi:hypothetical protein